MGHLRGYLLGYLESSVFTLKISKQISLESVSVVDYFKILVTLKCITFIIRLVSSGMSPNIKKTINYLQLIIYEKKQILNFLKNLIPVLKKKGFPDLHGYSAKNAG